MEEIKERKTKEESIHTSGSPSEIFHDTENLEVPYCSRRGRHSVDFHPIFEDIRLTNSTHTAVWNSFPGLQGSSPLLTKKLRIFICTWNLHGKLPSAKQVKSLLNTSVEHDIYIIGTQECQHSIATSLLLKSKCAWEKLLKEEEYPMICSDTLVATHIVMFANIQIFPIIKDIGINHIATGFGNTLGNKGGVSISCCIGGLRLLFICVHLAAGQTALKRRNADLERIERGLKTMRKKSGEPTPNFPDVVFLFGDLNYRINAKPVMAMYLTDFGFIEELLSKDQLRSMLESHHLFKGYQESPIHFLPTYKLVPNTHKYLITKDRIPSYTDRILFKVNTKVACKMITYDSLSSLGFSDHHPVFAQFLLSFEEDFDQPILFLTPSDAIQHLSSKEQSFGKTRRAICHIILDKGDT